MRAERAGVSAGAETKANTLGAGGALQRGHGALPERLAQLGDALGDVGVAGATDLVVGQAASMGRSESCVDRVTHPRKSAGADTKASTMV